MTATMMPVIPTAKRPITGFSIDSLMGKDTSSGSSSSFSPTEGSSAPRSDVPTMPAAFYPSLGSSATFLNGLRSYYDNASMVEGLGHLAASASMGNHHAALAAAAAAGLTSPHHAATLNGAAAALAAAQQASSISSPTSLHPMLLGSSSRDTFPLYPWLMSRHHNYLSSRFSGPDANLLLQPFRKPKRIRTAFSPSQLLRLEHAFEKNHYVVGQERKDLAASLNLTETQVKVWFQNRRTKYKRMKAEENGVEYREEDDHSEPESDIDESELDNVTDRSDGQPSPKRSKTFNYVNVTRPESQKTSWQDMNKTGS